MVDHVPHAVMSEEQLCGKDLIENGWFMEKNKQWPGQANSLQVKEVLRDVKTKFQDLLVFESTDWGKVLVLDGVIQLTEKDEMSYQEMMAHLPLFAHPNPKHVLVVGGGDGGVTREVCKHACVEKVVQYDIDAGVIDAAKEFFPTISHAYANPKVDLNIGDAVEFVCEVAKDSSFDVIIVDSSDPVGPAEKLFSKEFYASMHRILRPGGVICTQGECLWVHADIICAMKEYSECFAGSEYASIQVPTYPSGQIGAFLARKAYPEGSKDEVSCRKPRRQIPADMELRYYTEDMHSAAFALPAFLQKKLYGENGNKRRCLAWD